MDPRLGDTDFLKVTRLISGRAGIRTQGGMTSNLELLTTSSMACLFHLSGKLGFIFFFLFSTSCSALLRADFVLKQAFSTWQQGWPHQLGICEIPSMWASQKETRCNNGPGEGSAVSSLQSGHLTDNSLFCASMLLLHQEMESISFPPESEMVFSNTVTEVTFWDF